MTQPNVTDDGNVNDGNTQGGGGLRAQLEAALAANKVFEAELTTFRAEKRSGDVAKFLEAKGAPKGAAKFYDAEEVSEAAVDKWLKDNEGIFGVPTQQQAAPEPDDAATIAARAVANASHGHPEGDPLTEAAKALGDPEELMRLIQTGSDDELVKLGVLRPADKRHLVGGYTPPSPMQ